MGMIVFILLSLSLPTFAASKCTEEMLHAKTSEIARSKPMERPFLIQKVQASCPGFPAQEYEKMLQIVGLEATVEHCVRQYVSAILNNSSSLFFDVECRTTKFADEWKSIGKRTGVDPLLLTKTPSAEWNKVTVRKQGDGLFRVGLGSSHCVLLSVSERKIDSSKTCR